MTIQIENKQKKYTSITEMLADVKSEESWYERNIEQPFYQKIYNPISELYYDLKHLPGNLRKWGMFVLKDRDWDWRWTLEALEIKCRAQHKLMCKHGNAIDSKKWANEAHDTAEALKRLGEDDYTTEEEHSRIFDAKPPKNSFKALNRLENVRRKRDLKIVTKNINRIQGWWD